MTSTAPSPASRARGTAVILAVGLAAMVVSMTQTQVVPILGLIQHKLGTTAAGAGWVTTASLLSAAVFTPLLGRFGDQHGKKPTLVGVLVVLVAGSVLAAATDSLSWLIIGRVLQGAGIAIFPLALSVLREELPHERLHGAMALVSGTLAIGGGVSLVTTGLLTQGSDASYQPVFWLSAGLTVLALLAVVALVPASRTRSGGRIDVLGALTLGGFLVLLLLPISQGHQWGWGSAATIGCSVGAVLMAALWVLVERKVSDPMVDLRMFTHLPVLFTNVAGLLVGFAMFAQFLGVSYLVQMPPKVAGYGFGASVLRASVEYLLPSTLVSLLASPIGGVLVRRIGARTTLAIGAVIGAAGFGWLVVAHDTTASVIGGGVAIGIAISFGYAAMPALIVAGVEHHQTGIANALNSISRSVGSSIGSAIITTLLASKTVAVPHLPPGVPAPPAESQFTLAFGIACVALLLVVPVALLGLRRTHSPRVADPKVALPEPANA
ncbi:MFS transporter [Solihabitans fulvus]|uniref:MFS transporter n=1 Tax=Solihabitans fulvus TaxID=1892852 RepID=A0A5B2WE78_9PSEU|nr:MFS transporter [Solihabitans fulvus]KAA2250171.1 MFS transporter [Solihabitans fulvus]